MLPCQPLAASMSAPPSLGGTLAALWPEVEALLPPARRAPLARAEPVSGRVWRAALANGTVLALKLAAGNEESARALAMEAQALEWLARRGCPVPEVVARPAETPPRWLALSWHGDQTLEVLLATASPPQRARLGRLLAEAVASVEAAFQPLTAAERDNPPAWEARVRALRAQAAPWIAAAPEALAWLVEHPLDRRTRERLEQALALAFGAEPSIAGLDYNAQNVVFDGERLALLDFSAVGIDWPERRFVQYGTATGAASDGGGFVTVITPSSVRHYAALIAPQRSLDAAKVEQLVDAHDLWLLLIAAQQLRAVAEGSAVAARARAWRNVPQRRRQLLRLLRRRLIHHGPAETVRRRLR